MAQGEQLHISTWPAVWPTRRLASKTVPGEPATKQYDNIAANRTRTAAHCFEAKCFAVMCAGYMDKTIRETVVQHDPFAVETLDSLTQGQSCFLDPTGAQIGDSIQGEEGIAYAELDLADCVEPKQFHDTVGYYQLALRAHSDSAHGLGAGFELQFRRRVHRGEQWQRC